MRVTKNTPKRAYFLFSQEYPVKPLFEVHCGKISQFKGGEKNILFFAHSISVVDCGSEGFAEKYKIGDTLEQKYDCSLIVNNGKTFIHRIETIKTDNGGQDDSTIVANLLIKTDTSDIEIK
ncbi:hypothetical protein ACTHGU_05115 [Chitinophagaceae bacterium MMS25-I14]